MADAVLCVFGAGTMGGQIAHQAALHGFEVRLLSRRPERLESAMRDGAKVLGRRVEKGKLSDSDLAAAIGRITTLTEPAAALEGATLVIESVAEDRDAKREVLQRICEHVDDDVIIGTNSSTLPSSLLAAHVVNPERFLNVHFFNPPLQMPLVEVVKGPHTADATVNHAMDFAESIGKTPVLVRKETYGFIVNRVLFIAMQEAFRLVEDGVVSIEDCDVAVRNGLGWPMGMFELADLVGLDVVESILKEGLAQTGEKRWAPLSILHEHVARGELGRKSGHGFIARR